MNPLYESKQPCICCETPFVSSRVRSSFKKASRMDSDFCGYYSHGYNPDYYVVRVCPSCGFAATENGFEQLTEQQKLNYYERMGSEWRPVDYGGERTAKDALVCYKRALLTAQIAGAKERVIAGILHHIAWLNRELDNAPEELRFLKYALDAYIRVYELEGITASNARLMYMIGELHRRLGEYNDAVKWFSRVINDQKIVDAASIRACREQWQAIREDMEAKRLAEGV